MNKEKFVKDYEGILSEEAITKTRLLEAKRLLGECWAEKYLEYSDTIDSDGKKRSEKKIEAFIITDTKYISKQKDYQEVYLQAHLASMKVKVVEALLHLELKEP